MSEEANRELGPARRGQRKPMACQKRPTENKGLPEEANGELGPRLLQLYE